MFLSASRRRPVLALSAVVAGGLALSGCSAFSDDAAGTASGDGGSDGVRVVAAFYPLQWVSEQVAGDRASVTNLTSPGAEPHDLELTVSQTAELAGADLVVYEHDFQPAVDEAVEQNATGATLDVASDGGGADLVPFDDEHVDEDHAGDDHSEEDHAGEEGEDHDHGELDPHFWQDPERLADVADAVAEQLSEVDPDGADDFRSNAEALRADLEDLDQQYRDGLTDCSRDVIVVSHDAFGYLGKYGLTMEPIAGLSPEAEPTPADLARLQSLITSDGITTVFSETLAPRELSETLADDAGVSTAVLDPIEGLSDDTADQDYLSLMEQNLTALQKANGCS